MGNLGQQSSVNADRVFFGSFDTDEHHFLFALSTKTTAAHRENIVAFERWLDGERAVRNGVRLTRLNVGPSKSHVWQQLHWITKFTGANSAPLSTQAAAERECAALLIARTTSEQHRALERAQSLSTQVFGDRYNDIFDKAHTVIGSSEPVADWPVLLAA
jgi:hypothetical protein